VSWLAAVWAWLVALWADINAPRLTYSVEVTCLRSEGYEFDWLWKGVAQRSDGAPPHSWFSRGDDSTWQSFDLDGMVIIRGELADALNIGRARELGRIRGERLLAAVEKAGGAP
jgi:hypothetical protein